MKLEVLGLFFKFTIIEEYLTTSTKTTGYTVKLHKRSIISVVSVTEKILDSFDFKLNML